MAKKFYREDDPLGYSVKYSETPLEGFTEIIDPTELDVLYFKLNNKLIEDGKNYASKFKVEIFGVKYRSGLLTDQNVDYLYNKLSQLLIRLADGSWNSAKYILQNTLNTIAQEDIDNGYTQEVHDKILNDITSYLESI